MTKSFIVKTPFTFPIESGKYKGKWGTIAGSTVSKNMGMYLSLRIHDEDVDPNGYNWFNRVDHAVPLGTSRTVSERSRIGKELQSLGIDLDFVMIWHKF